MAPLFLGRRRGWCVPCSGPLLANKRTKNKGQREQEADRGQFLFRNVAAVWFAAKPCVRDSGPGPVNLVCLPNVGHTHLFAVIFWPGIAAFGLLHRRASEATAIGTAANIC